MPSPRSRTRPVFIADFSPPRGGDPALLADASKLDVDFVCVAYNPGKAVRDRLGDSGLEHRPEHRSAAPSSTCRHGT